MLRVILENETWVEAQVTGYYQGLVNILNSLELAEDEYIQLEEYNETNQAVEVHTSFTANGQEFKTVSAMQQVVHIIYEYIKIIRFFPDIAVDGAIKMFEVIKEFNSKANALVLGGGAVYSQKLNNITAKNLSLSAQCVCFLLEELPFLKSQIMLNLKD